MRVLITGGSGLIGRPLAASLASANHEVILLSRDPARVAGLPDGVRAVRWDACSAEGWGRLADGAGAIINLASKNLGASRWTAERKVRILQSRLDSGSAVVEAVQAAKVKPRVVLQSSGVGYYGMHADQVLAEDAPVGDDFLAQVAADWEESTAPVEALGVRRVVLRSGVVLSKEGGALPRYLLPFRFFVGGPLGGGRQWVPWIHIDDEVAAILFLMEQSTARGPFNLCSPQPVTSADFAIALGKATSRPALVPAPAPAIRLLFGEMAELVLGGQRAVPKRLLELGFRFRYPEATEALKALGLGHGDW